MHFFSMAGREPAQPRREEPAQPRRAALSEEQERLARQVASLLQHRYQLTPQNAYSEARAMVATVADRYDGGRRSFYSPRMLTSDYTARIRADLEHSLQSNWLYAFRQEPRGALQTAQADSIAHDFLRSQGFLPPGTIPRLAETREAAPERVYRYEVVMGLLDNTATYLV